MVFCRENDSYFFHFSLGGVQLVIFRVVGFLHYMSMLWF
jgi:hypothetical protein